MTASIKPTGTYRLLGDLLNDVRDKRLLPRPKFQRNLVWTNDDKELLIDSVLRNYPFPEIFVASGPRQPHRTDRLQLLVDGQQRIQTLLDYTGPEAETKLLYKKVGRYSELSEKERNDFLDYQVAVRELGTVTDEVIREVFRRINSTNYVLKSMEVFNALYNGAYINYCVQLTDQEFFKRHGVFREVDRRRMQDRTFCVTLVTTVLAGAYYKRDEKNDEYLRLNNDDFPQLEQVQAELDRVFTFVESLDLPADSRAWKQLDLLTLLVEVHNALVLRRLVVNGGTFAAKLLQLYQAVDATKKGAGVTPPDLAPTDALRTQRYFAAATRAANDKSQRVARGEVVAELLTESAVG